MDTFSGQSFVECGASHDGQRRVKCWWQVAALPRDRPLRHLSRNLIKVNFGSQFDVANDRQRPSNFVC